MRLMINDVRSEATKQNSEIINFVIQTCNFSTVTYEMVFSRKV